MLKLQNKALLFCYKELQKINVKEEEIWNQVSIVT